MSFERYHVVNYYVVGVHLVPLKYNCRFLKDCEQSDEEDELYEEV